MTGSELAGVPVDHGWLLAVINQYWKLLTASALGIFFLIKLHFRVRKLEEKVEVYDKKLERILDRVDKVYLLLISRADNKDQ